MPTFIRPARVQVDTDSGPAAVIAIVAVTAVAAVVIRYLAVITDALEVACLAGAAVAGVGAGFAVRCLIRDRGAIWHGQGSIWRPASVAELTASRPEVAAVVTRPAITGQVVPAITAGHSRLADLDQAASPVVILASRNRGAR